MMKNILEKWQNFLRKDCVSWYGIKDTSATPPGTGTDNSKLGRKRTGGKGMAAGQQRRRSGGLCDTGLFTERCPLLDVLHNIHPNVRYAWKYKGSNGYIV